MFVEGGRLGSEKEKDIAVVIFNLKLFNVTQKYFNMKYIKYIYMKHYLECFYDYQGLTSYQGLNSKWQHENEYKNFIGRLNSYLIVS